MGVLQRTGSTAPPCGPARAPGRTPLTRPPPPPARASHCNFASLVAVGILTPPLSSHGAFRVPQRPAGWGGVENPSARSEATRLPSIWRGGGGDRGRRVQIVARTVAQGGSVLPVR